MRLQARNVPSSIATVARYRDVIKQLHNTGYQRSDIGQRSSVEHLADALTFGFVNQSQPKQLLLGAAAGVEFNWQSDELEQRDDRENGNNDRQHHVQQMKDYAHEKDSHVSHAGELRDWNQRHARIEQTVRFLMLQCVTGFMSCNAYSRHAIAVVIIR